MTISQGLCTSRDLVLLDLEARDRKQVLEELGKKVLLKKYINSEYISAVAEREDEFPTGLEMPIPIAIPHIGMHCNQSFLALAVLQSPVGFFAMDNSDKELPVELVFMFGITDPSDQVEVLKKFIFAFRHKENLERIKKIQNTQEAIDVLNSLLDNCLIVC